MHTESLKLAEELGRLEAIADQYRHLGTIAGLKGEASRAELLRRKALQIFESIGMVAAAAAVKSELPSE